MNFKQFLKNIFTFKPEKTHHFSILENDTR